MKKVEVDCLGQDHNIKGHSDNGNKNEVNAVNQQELSWRLNSSVSLSDWTMAVQCQTSLQIQEYHIHRKVLVAGPCESDYFCDLFKSYSDEQGSNTNITLDDQGALFFPVLLDFLYSSNQDLAITTDNAMALRYLAQYFGMRAMYRKVMDFVRQDIKLTNVATYYTNATSFKDEKMILFVLGTIVTHIQDVSTSSPLLKTLDPNALFEVISAPQLDTFGVSCHLSTLVAAYCKIHQADLDKEMFSTLTDCKFLPLIHKDAALLLLELEVDLCGKICATSELSCLQQRCISAWPAHWEITDNQEAQTLGVFYKLPGNVLAELLHKSIWTPAHERKSTVADAKATEAKLVKTTDELEKHVSTLNGFCRVPMDFSKNPSQLLAVCNKSGEFLLFYCNEVRVPKRPSAMPNGIRCNPERGCLYIETVGNTEYYWPLYYYKEK